MKNKPTKTTTANPKNLRIMEVYKHYEINVKGKGFLLIGTSRTGVWTNGKPFTILLDNDLSAFEGCGLSDNYEKAQSLEVGEKLETDFPEEGVIIIRVQ